MPHFAVVLTAHGNVPVMVVGPYRSEAAADKGAAKHLGTVVPIVPGATPKYQVEQIWREQRATA
jgi:hypothetical protein